MKDKRYITKKQLLSAVFIVAILLTIGYVFVKDIYFTTDTSIIKSSKTTQNMIDSKARLKTLSIRTEKEYGWKTSKNNFTILVEKETKNYTLEEELIDVPELTIYDSYTFPGKKGTKTTEYRRIYQNDEIYKETVLSETIDEEASPPVYFRGTIEIFRWANQFIKNATILAESPTDFRFVIRGDASLDIYYKDKKFYHIDGDYESFINYPSLDEFMMIAKITGFGEKDYEELIDAYTRSANGEALILDDRYALIRDGSRLKFLSSFPKKISDEYYELIDFDAYYEKYGQNKNN